METFSKSLEETKQLARMFVEETLRRVEKEKPTTASLVALEGDLGTGKTAFVKAVAEVLGITQMVTSPTFVIEKVYKLDNQPFNHLVHIDAYRLEGAEELNALGWEALIKDPKNFIFLEWADRVSGGLPSEKTTISFEYENETTRKIVIQGK